MMQSYEDAAPEVSLIVSVIAMGIRDAVCYKNPRKLSSFLVGHKFSAAEVRAAEAREFLNRKCRIFKYYCGLIGLDPEWVEKKAWESINYSDSLAIKKAA